MRSRTIVLPLLALALGFLVGRGVTSDEPIEAAASSETAAIVPVAYQPASIPDDLMPEEKRDIEIFRRATSSVVNITTSVVGRNYFSLDLYEIPRGTGSGFIWDRSGHVVTNFHVIDGGDAFKVRLSDQSTYDAKVVGYAADKDLAVLRISAPSSKLDPLELGRSRDLLVGMKVLALGNPFGLDHSLTVGVVSALGRELKSPNERTIHDVIQTDAAINPGNSGGPLLDSRGRLIGVNSQIYSPSGAFAGIGFAIPIDTVGRLVPQLITNGRPIQPGIGVSVLHESFTRRHDLDGIVIRSVRRGGPADRAGLEGIEGDRSGNIRIGDSIVEVNGKEVDTLDDLLHEFEVAGVGKTVALTVIRDGKKRRVQVTLTPTE